MFIALLLSWSLLTCRQLARKNNEFINTNTKKKLSSLARKSASNRAVAAKNLYSLSQLYSVNHKIVVSQSHKQKRSLIHPIISHLNLQQQYRRQQHISADFPWRRNWISSCFCCRFISFFLNILTIFHQIFLIKVCPTYILKNLFCCHEIR